MSTELHGVDDLRDALRARAETVQEPVGLSRRVAENARRVRTRRRVVATAAVVAGLAVLSPIVLQALAEDRQDPVTPAPRITSTLRWSETLPGVNLPLGLGLAAAYAVGGKVMAGSLEQEFEGQDVTQILESAAGMIVVTRANGGAVSSISLVDASEAVVSVAEGLQLSGSVVQGIGADGETHIAFAVDGPAAPEVFAGPVLDPQPLGADGRYQAAGFLDGEPVFDSVVRPQMLTQFHTATRGSPTGPVEREVIDTASPAPEGSTELVGWQGADDRAVVFHTSTNDGCTSARYLPGGVETWTRCTESHDVAVIGVDYGAVGSQVFELASPGRVITQFDLPQSELDDVTYDLEALGWETPTDVIIRIAAYDDVGGGGIRGSPASGSYVAVRCSVETGACERLPHPVDVVITDVDSTAPE